MMMRMMRNPIYERERRTDAKTSRYAVFVTTVAAVLSLAAILSMAVTLHAAGDTGEMDYRSFLGYFRALCWGVFAVLMAIIPAQTAAAVSGERERRTLDLILTTPLTASDVIAGYILSSMSTAAAVVLTCLPPFAAVLVFGGVRGTDLVLIALGVLSAALFASCLGLFFSSFCARTGTAAAMTYVAEALILFGPYLISFLTSGIGADAGGTGSSLIALLSPIGIFDAGLCAAAGSGPMFLGVRITGIVRELRHIFLLGIAGELVAALILSVVASVRLAGGRVGKRAAAK